MSEMNVMVLGAGQEVGRSCAVLNVDDTYLMFDCGMHLGFKDARRFPDFSLLPFHRRMTEMLTAVLITHFHLDHSAALPYLTETYGYQGPIFMTHPTKSMLPIMLEDYHKVMTERQGGREWYTKQDIAKCMRQVVCLDLNTATQIAPGVVVTALYAGHVLGAVQFHVSVHGRTVLYTGDFNTTPDRHLDAAQLSRLRPHLLISESTYATTLRDSKKSRERDLLGEVLSTVKAGGKVLIPVFAVGRAQELLILMEEAWRRAGLAGQVPLYFSGVSGSRANNLYRSHVNWASQQLRSPGARTGAFAFEGIQAWQPDALHAKGPCVLFASPGMLNGGLSLEVFKAWAPDAANLVVLPGYQAAGTVGGKLMSGQVSTIQLGSATVTVKCKVRYLSFSAHSDAAGILQLAATTCPATVMLLHGDKVGMEFMASRITRLLGIPCLTPPNGGDWIKVPCQALAVPLTLPAPLRDLQHRLFVRGRSVHKEATKQPAQPSTASRACGDELTSLQLPLPSNRRVIKGVLLGRKSKGQAVDLQLLTHEQTQEFCVDKQLQLLELKTEILH